MKTRLDEIIKEGYQIQKGIYPDNGGGLYASYSFKDRNKYIKWVINTTRFIETNFLKDESYTRFLETLDNIEKELSLGGFSQILFILENYSARINNQTPNTIPIDLIINSLKSSLKPQEFDEIINILTEDQDEIKQKQRLGEYLKCLENNKLENILIPILTNKDLIDKISY